jgi:hypothetical protein
MVDKQRIAAIRKLEQLGYTFAGDDWTHSANDGAAIAPTITDELHAMLVKRADDLEGCPAGSDEEHELAAIERAIGPIKLSGGRWVERRTERASE